jgi:hypothetical protein
MNADHQSCVLQQSAWRLVVIPVYHYLCSVYFAGIRSKHSYRTYLLFCV